jgi:hypothetical protein
MRGIKTMFAILRGKAIVLVKRDDSKVDVMVGKSVNKQFALNSLAGAIKAMSCNNI